MHIVSNIKLEIVLLNTVRITMKFSHNFIGTVINMTSVKSLSFKLMKERHPVSEIKT
jgi:hypothetical protein